ncbi:hypothetical protein ASPCADRAFT_398039 [Aspergillus carbonarius ITEM 5010]|uniref:Uncharacterized protein n=1 Tax=Aspergillus carbonarius (strain ITEM 5010) TaxID=602072 RepID=A0A1R3RIU7_ASPC5|nr:hypothetical protein ASPCADRAFT_398039 [Aspergillus carbonarius ITEM 5010]
MTGRTPGESGDLDRPISRVATPVCSEDGHSQENNHGTIPAELPKVSFEELAVCYHQNQHKQTSRKRLERRLHALKVSMGVSARFVRVGSVVQRGLVDRLKHDDKANFIALYHTLGDLQESCDSAFRRHFHRQDPLEEWSPIRESAVDPSPDFFLQLSPQSRTDLLDIIHLVRTDPQFILERLRSLTPTQLAALMSSTGPSGEPGDISFPSTSRSRTHTSFSKRSSASSLPFKDRALNFERTDALSTLLFNVYAAPLDSDAPDAQLRLDVWSSVCAKLIADGGNKYDPLLGHILGSWATSSEWKAKSKFELYLMDVLQTGSFLLEHVETPPGMSFGAESPDPLRTEVAEEFFASAVDDLFQLLDDPDGGLPHAVMQLSSAILQKLERQDGRARFLEFLFVQWFFSKFLYGALTYPEAHGLLLDFHIRNDAREKLLGQVGFRAYSQVYAVLHSMHHYSMARPAVRRHVENMLCRFSNAKSEKSISVRSSSRAKSTTGRESPAAFLMLSATDVLTLLNALFPRTLASTCSSPLSSSGMPSSPVGSLAARSDRSIASIIEPGFFRPATDSIPIRVPQDRSIFATEMAFLSLPENCMSRNADRIRFELSDLSEPDRRTTLEPPAAEEWTIFSMTQNGRCLAWGLFPDDGQSSFPENASVDDVQSTTLGMEDNFEALQTAIVKLIQDHPADNGAEYGLLDLHGSSQGPILSLKHRFDMAMKHCHHDSDFIGAHYWWNAGRQLVRSVANSPSRLADDSWILAPMHASCVRSLATSRAVIDRCETDFVALNRHMQRMQRAVKETMATVAKLRDKMWYMTDVKNSMRYEDAKNVALALKTMARSANQTPNEGRSRSSMRPFGSSLLQKPELQVLNIMKAPSSQGPNKLSDEQVDLIRKWLSHNSIDNFCKGEERIHRFCYEVKTSINRLVGETMAETPVLWASELYHKERAIYEGSSNRNFLSLSSSLRPFNVSSEDTAYPSQAHGNNIRPPNTASKFSQDLPPLNPKSSFQSLISDKWRGPREPSIADASSIGGSPGRAASTTTGDSYSTFWSTPHQPAHYAPSASSLYSRPPSMFSDNGAQQPRRNDRKAHSKTTFLDDLKQTLTSLLLSDLGSPVWSCGSETDAWFGGKLTDRRIQIQMRKRARIQQFYAESDERLVQHTLHRTLSNRRRSRSLESSDRATLGDAENPSSSTPVDSMEPDGMQQFSYGSVFRRLLDVFSRHGNPCVKLKALRDLRALVVASLNSDNGDTCNFNATKPPCPRGRTAGSHTKRSARHSFSESQPKRSHGQNISHIPTSPAAESVIFDSRPSDYGAPTENQIVDALRSLLLEVKPKTLFRDLQYISAFVPGETLNKSDSGTAFLQFGLAALSLKDEVCNSMVEIADNIVSQEFSRRHLPGSDQSPRPGHTLLDAAKMWIITAKEGNPVAQRELAILYLTHPELLPPVTLPLTLMRDTFKTDMMYRRDKDSKSDPQSMCLALHWMQLSANGGDELARNRLREREEFESIA